MLRTIAKPLCLCLGLTLVGCDDKKKKEPEQPRPVVQQQPDAPKPPGEKQAPAQEITVTGTNPDAVTAFKRGRYLIENARIEEGVQEIGVAVSQDKQFPLALAYLGFFTPTEEGLMMLERAVSLASDLPKPEKLYVEHLLTWRRGDTTVLRDQRKMLDELAPGDWRVQYELGDAAREERNWSEAESRFKKAIALNENAGAAFNMLGITLMEQGKFDEAVKWLQKYAEQMPKEPAPHDSMGEANMRAGKLAEAEKAFQKAAELVPGYTQAWFGLAQCRFLQGDSKGGREALKEAAKSSAGPAMALEAKNFGVWSLMAERDWKGALAAVDDLEKMAKMAKDGRWYALAAVQRAAIHSESGKHPQVSGFVNQAVARAQSARLAGDALSEVLGSSHLWKVRSELKTRKLSQAEASLELLSKAIQLAPGPKTLSMRSHATGLISEARGDKEIAIQQLLECTEIDYLCRADLYRLQKGSDPAAADKVLKSLLSSPRRDPLYLYAWSNLKGAGTASATP